MKKLLLAALAGAALSVSAIAAVVSGLQPGEQISAFHPFHVSGPLANSEKCFPCTYQSAPQVQVWVNGDDLGNVAKIAKMLNKVASENNKFHAMVVFLTTPENRDATIGTIRQAAKDTKADRVAMAVLDKNHEAVAAYKVNTGADVKNTVFVYENWKISRTFVNKKADDLNELQTAINSILN